MSEHVVVTDPLVQAMKGKGAKPTTVVPPLPTEPSSVSRETLASDIETLARSLGVTPAGNGEYEPDAFVRAIRKRHDALVDVTAKLTKQNEEQRLKAIELAQREAAVLKRERMMDALEEISPKGAKSWWRL